MRLLNSNPLLNRMTDKNHLLHCIATSFATTFDIPLSKESIKTQASYTKKFNKLEPDDKYYYTKYAFQIVKNLTEYIDDIKSFEFVESETIDFNLRWGDNYEVPVSLSYYEPPIRNIIPAKLMKICKYTRNSKVYQKYDSEYTELSNSIYQEIGGYDKFSELDDETKQTIIYDPIMELIKTTLTKKRLCAGKLFNHLFDKPNIIMIKLQKYKFTIYDFNKDIDDATSFRINISKGKLIFKFNNGCNFSLKLQTNSSEIKEYLSLKFITKFINLDDLFCVCANSKF